ncbi:PilZ domain-containing protein [Oscillospiraceae bacterium OttesenSCG-928-F05]|nr:PilZ domain-containing protein [Oscillospiraceae bacterium OttesenSCG-928-F05]
MYASDTDVRVGDRLDVTVGQRKCVCDVRAIPEGDTYVVTAPAVRGIPVPVRENDIVNVMYYKAAGMLSFVAAVTRLFEEEGGALAELTMKSPISRYQRRDFVRFDTALPLSLRILALPEEVAAGAAYFDPAKLRYDAHFLGIPRAKDPEAVVIESETKDISGGGLRFATNYAFEPYSVVECSIGLLGGDCVAVDGVIVRMDEEENAQSRYIGCVQFIDLEERVRRRILKYIYDAQKTDGAPV